MTAVTWAKIRELLDAVLELPPDERTEYLDGAGVEPSLRHYVESLILSYDKAGDFLDEPAVASLGKAMPEEDGPSLSGQRLGPYRILEEIGEGGMGAVYRAVRADDEYQKQVAIKVVRGGLGTRFTLGRFKAERQILASLEHPNIARLLDGGTSDDGMPYFVMELIEGQPIDAYCDEHQLSTAERLKLFRTVCSAVHYAHQHLVVHRDLKPGNMLVSADGVPKLLDFGIAKILDPQSFPHAVDPTMTVLRLLTPEFASPEQVRGETITTASDVYSLGVVLYLLLTGHRPYGGRSRTAPELVRAICESEPVKPSVAVGRVEEAVGADGVKVTLTPESVSKTREGQAERLRSRLQGDLDNIILKALAKETERRYSSAEQFSEDLRRHLEGMPVTARRATWSYRSGKFIGRHTAGVAAAVLVAVSLVAGMALTLREARIARAQRARAERRFNDVRKLANSLMFEIHDAIKDLPGSTPARKLLVEKALRYLDSLSREASGDKALQQELAAAYERVGDVEGDPYSANLGDPRGALVSYRKGLAIRQQLLGAIPNDRDALWAVSGDYNRIGKALDETGVRSAAVDNFRMALKINEQLAAGSSKPQELDFLAGGYYFLASELVNAGHLNGARENYEKAVAVRRRIQATNAADSLTIRTHLAGDYEGLSRVLISQGNFAQGTKLHAAAAAILTELTAAYPTNATLRMYLGESYSYFATEIQDHDRALAWGSFVHALAIYETLSMADPTNALSKRYLGFVSEKMGIIQVENGELQGGIERLDRALSIFESLPASEAKSVYARSAIAFTYAALGDAYASLAGHRSLPAAKQAQFWSLARSNYRRSVGVRTKTLKSGGEDPLGNEEAQLVAKNLAKCDGALAKLRKTPASASR